MKVIWEPADIRAGCRYSRADIKEVWMIGYIPTETDSYVSISMSDGLVTDSRSANEMAKGLTEQAYWPTELLQKQEQT